MGLFSRLFGKKSKTQDNVPFSASVNSYVPRHNHSVYFQKLDESYNSELGYEWFKICVERVNFPLYNNVGTRLTNLRNIRELTQANAANQAGLSPATLSSYENGYTSPNDKTMLELSNVYGVPFQFAKYGYVDDLYTHLLLCQLYGEHDYITSLSVSVRAASGIFSELLTQEDKDACVLVDKELELKLNLFDNKIKILAELTPQIKADILSRLEQGDVKQSELYKSFGENRGVAQEIVYELYNSGIISKEKSGNTYILSLSKG